MKKIIAFSIMAAIVASAYSAGVKPAAYSVQQALLIAGDSVAQTDSGEVIIKYFSWTSTALTNQTVALVRIPANTRIIGGAIATEDMGGGEVMDLGLIGVNEDGFIDNTDSTADDTDLFMDGVANPFDTGWDSGGASSGLADTVATYASFDKDVYLALTAADGDPVWATNKTVTGWVMYLK